MVAHDARFSVYQIMLGHEMWVWKMWDGQLTFITTLVFVCPWMRIYCKFSFITATDFLTSAEFPHGGKHHEQNSNLDLPPRKATGSSFFFGLLLNNIVGNTYTAIHHNRGAIFFTHPPLPEVWPYSQNFWSRHFRFLTPHSLISSKWCDIWFIWIPTTKCKSLLRVENVKELNLLYYYYVSTRFRCFSSNGFTLRIFVLSDLFLHWTLLVPFVWTDVIAQDSALWSIPSFHMSTFWPTW